VRNAYTIFSGISDGKNLLERLNNKWQDNITMDFKNIFLGQYSGQSLAAGCYEYYTEPSGFTKVEDFIKLVY
jgi:hypothetical protein